MASAKTRDWEEICKPASKETDSEKLMALVADLVKALDSRKTPPRKRQNPSHTLIRPLFPQFFLDLDARVLVRRV